MKYISQKLLFILAAIAVFSACNKVKELPYYNNGNAVTLSSSADAIAPTPADSSNQVISFAWTNPNYAADSSKFKYIVEIDSSGRNFSNKVTKLVTGTLSTSFTGKELNTILLNYGFSPGANNSLDVRVVSSYGNNNEQYTSNVVTVTVAAYGDASVLSASTTSAILDINTANDHAIDFTWGSSFNGYSGTVTYTLQYDSSGKGFATPFEIAVGSAVYTKGMTQSELNETALDAGIPGGNSGDVEYRIKATTEFGATAYSNTVVVTIQTYFPLLRFYLPGGYQSSTGNGNDWDPGTAPELIRDLRPDVFNDMYYIYIYLPANAEFKITQGRSWDVNYGGTGGDLSQNGANFSVATAGVYRISINRKTLKYDIREGRMGFVGGAVTGVDWNPPSVFPTSAMHFMSLNKFLGLYDFGGGGWKMIDNDQWNNGSFAVDETRSYGSNGPTGSTLDVNAENMPDIVAGVSRVIWDGTDPNNIKYELYQGLRVVGAFQGWDPSTAPDMTYQGNGVWKTTITLPAGEFKFVSANGWDYNYGGSGGVLSRNGGNLNVGAGTYTITVDEYNQTYTIL